MENKIKHIFNYKDKRKIINILITILGSSLYAIGIKLFIMPAGFYTGGFTGIAQLISVFFKNVYHVTLPVNYLWFLLNIPVFYLGYKGVGKRFTTLSILSVFSGMIAMGLLPTPDKAQMITQDAMLNAIAGGTLAGLGVGICLKVGASTGGMDIVSQFLSYRNDASFAQFSFILNGFIVLIAGVSFSVETALYTIINLFVSSLIIDKIHTRHNKLTLLIVTDRKDELVAELHKRIYRGITVISGTGSYTRNEKTILFMVISSYELYGVTSIINEVDPHSFTDVIKSQNVIGNFFKMKVE